jgi:hypothetical protein
MIQIDIIVRKIELILSHPEWLTDDFTHFTG